MDLEKCGLGDVWTRGRVDLRTWRRVDTVVPRKSLSAVADKSQRSWFALICLLAYYTAIESSEYRICSMQRVVYFVSSHG